MSIKVTRHGRYQATIQRGMEQVYLGVWRERESAEWALRAARGFVVSEKLCRREKEREARLAKHAVHQGALWDKSKPLDVSELKRRLDYDSGSGLFRWRGGRLDYHPGWLVGAIAGKVNAKGYVVIDISGRAYQASRLAWLWEKGEWPRRQVDHINHVTWDNRIENLREADQTQQMWNQRVRRDGLKGCYFDEWNLWRGKRKRRAKPWVAQITVHGVKKKLGRFHTEEEAHRAYAAAAREHFGEYMCLE